MHGAGLEQNPQGLQMRVKRVDKKPHDFVFLARPDKVEEIFRGADEQGRIAVKQKILDAAFAPKRLSPDAEYLDREATDIFF